MILLSHKNRMIPTRTYLFYFDFVHKDWFRYFLDLRMIVKWSEFICLSIFEQNNQIKPCHRNIFYLTILFIYFIKKIFESERNKLFLIFNWVVYQTMWSSWTFYEIIIIFCFLLKRWLHYFWFYYERFFLN